MKRVTLLFIVLLSGIHLMDHDPVPLNTPLSKVRDGSVSWAGYTLFGLLLFSAQLLVMVSIRKRKSVEAIFFVLEGILLSIVAATPSKGIFHLCCALFLMLMLYIHFAWLLHRCGTRLFWIHLASPILILLAIEAHSYGLWQKSMILYFLVALNIRYSCLQRCELDSESRKRKSPWDTLRKSSRVYVVEAEGIWNRRRRIAG